MTVQQIYTLLDTVAPFDTQEPFDNSGLIVGSMQQEVSAILFALDVTNSIISEARALGVNLIISHHPLLFEPVHCLTDETFEGRLIQRMIRERMSLIACHTCLDKAAGGINDALAERCALLDVRGEGFVRVGDLPHAMRAKDLKEYLAAALDTEVRLMGDTSASVSCLGLCSGAGGSEWNAARLLGAQGFLSGEIKHHHALAMAEAGIPCFECGHFATEQPGIFALAEALQNALDQVKYSLSIYMSQTGPYPA